MWATLIGAPFVTISSKGLKNGQSSTPNNGADWGPDNDTTGTMGFQDALNSISSGGMLYVYGAGSAVPYEITQALHNTGNGQVVWFEPNAVILNNITQGSAGDGASIIYPFSNTTYPSGSPQGTPTAGYANCYWVGNGAGVNGNSVATNVAVQVNVVGPLSGGTTVAYDCEFGGFNLTNVAGGGLSCVCSNGHGSTPTDLQTNHNIRFYQITATFSSSAVASNSGIPCGVNSCNRIVFEDLDFDCSAFPNFDYSNPFVWSAQGNTHNIVFRRCHFKGNGISGQVLELQGSGVSGGAPSSSVTSQILFEDCIFDSGASSVVSAGSGGGYIDDNNNVSENAFVTDIEFRRCFWINNGIEFQSNASVTANPYGYIRFQDCRNMPGSFTSYLPSRWPINASNPPLTITVGASPFTYPSATNPSLADPFPETVVVEGGTVTTITFDGVATGVKSGVFQLHPGDYLTVTYTAAPTMYKMAN
jgi:hypothetical protein